MRLDYELPLLSRETLSSFLTSFIFAVTAKHEFASDNIPYKVDPNFEGVRLPPAVNGELPTKAGLGAYILGMSVSVLTTLRSSPLLNDWSHLFADNKHADRLVQLHHDYKYKLLQLGSQQFQEFDAVPQNFRSHTFNPATHGSSIAV